MGGGTEADGFLSTPSGWRATEVEIYPIWSTRAISIHALRVEGDRVFVCVVVLFNYFYPRPPGGGRHRFALP